MITMNMYRVVSDLEGPDEVADFCDGGWDAMYKAVSLWRLCGSERADTLHRLLVEIEKPGADGERVMYREQVQRAVELLEGIELAALSLCDEKGYLPPERVAEAEKLDSEIVELMRYPDGTTGHKVINALFRVKDLRVFLRDSLREGGLVVLE